jgi:hypothetical protein
MVKVNFHKEIEGLKCPTDCPALIWKLDKDNGDGDFDVEILPLLKLLNNNKWHTVASCAGHSLDEIEKYNKGYLNGNPYKICIYIHVEQDSIKDFSKMADEMSDAVDDSFWCELGYNSFEYSNKTEDGYIPFYIQVFGRTKKRRDEILKKLKKVVSNY